MSLITNYGNAAGISRQINAPEGLDRIVLLNGRTVSYKDNQENYLRKGYDINDIVYSIVNLIIEKVRLAPWGLYKVTDKSSLKKSIAFSKQLDNAESFRQYAKLIKKALEPVEKTDSQWAKLLEYPNDKDTWQDFIANGCGYKLLTGNKYIHADLIPGGRDGNMPNYLALLPSQWVNIIVDKMSVYEYPMVIRGYRLMPLPNKVFPANEVLHEKYMNYGWDVGGQQLYGVAPLKAALNKVNLSNSIADTNIAKIQNGGVETVLYVDDTRMAIPQAQNQANATKNYLVNEGTGPVNWGKIATSGYKMGAVKLGSTPVELDLYKAEMAIIRSLCNVFGGVPSTLLNDPENKTFNNMKEGEKALTSRCAMPLLRAAADYLNKQAHQFWGLPKEWIIDFDATVYSELQEDMKEKATWVMSIADKTMMSANEVRGMMDIETRDEPIMNEPLVNTAKIGTPLNEYDTAADVNIDDEDGTI